MKLALSLPVLIAIALASHAAEPTAAEKAVSERDGVYVAAFNKGDVKALSALYTEDAQYTTADGETISGRAAIAGGLTKFFARNKGAKLEVKTDSARLLTPDVLIEKGIATVGDDVTKYTCTYVKKESGWLIAQLDETDLPPADEAEQALGELAWLVGSWKDNSPGISVETKVSFTLNDKFLRRSFKVTREGDDPLEGTEVIGYDPVSGQIRSWTFDSEGGFGEGMWRQDKNKWLITAKATAPDGTTSSAQHVVTVIDNNKFTWESINRQSEGQTLPNLDKIEVVRASGQ